MPLSDIVLALIRHKPDPEVVTYDFVNEMSSVVSKTKINSVP